MVPESAKPGFIFDHVGNIACGEKLGQILFLAVLGRLGSREFLAIAAWPTYFFSSSYNISQ